LEGCSLHAADRGRRRELRPAVAQENDINREGRGLIALIALAIGWWFLWFAVAYLVYLVVRSGAVAVVTGLVVATGVLGWYLFRERSGEAKASRRRHQAEKAVARHQVEAEARKGASSTYRR
jgi:hypothetical protein